MKTTTNKNRSTPSVVSTSSAAVGSGFTLGLDLGDRQHHVCVLDVTGQIIREASLPNTRPALAQLLAEFPRSTVALESTPSLSCWIRSCVSVLRGVFVFTGMFEVNGLTVTTTCRPARQLLQPAFFFR